MRDDAKYRLLLLFLLGLMTALVTVPACVALKQKPVVELPPMPPGMVAERTVQRSAMRTPVAPPVVRKVQLLWDGPVIDPLETPASATNYRILVYATTNATQWYLKTNVKQSPVTIIANRDCEFYRLKVTNTYTRICYE